MKSLLALDPTESWKINRNEPAIIDTLPMNLENARFIWLVDSTIYLLLLITDVCWFMNSDLRGVVSHRFDSIHIWIFSLRNRSSLPINWTICSNGIFDVLPASDGVLRVRNRVRRAFLVALFVVRRSSIIIYEIRNWLWRRAFRRVAELIIQRDTLGEHWLYLFLKCILVLVVVTVVVVGGLHRYSYIKMEESVQKD